MYSWLAFLSPPGTVTYVDAGTAVQLGNDYTDELPCLPEEPCPDPNGTSVVRSCDGVHLCPGDDSHRDRRHGPMPRVVQRRLPVRPGDGRAGDRAALTLVELGEHGLSGLGLLGHADLGGTRANASAASA